MGKSIEKMKPIENESPLLVINGCPRSGTSLLERLLAQEFNAAVMPETHFIPRFTPFLFLWGHLKTASQRKNLINAIYDFIEIRTNGNSSALDVEQMRPYNMLATQPFLDDIAAQTNTYADILFRLFDTYRQLHHGSIAIEKTAYYHAVSWDKIAKVMPKAKFLHVIRDGRDVALSWCKTSFGPKDLSLAAWLWAQHIRKGLLWEERNVGRCLRVRYEDLARNQEKVLETIAAFIKYPLTEVKYDQPSTRWYTFITSAEHMKNLCDPIQKNNTEKWRHAMTADELEIFEAVAGSELQKAGYPLAASGANAVSKGTVQHRLLKAWLSNSVSKTELKRLMAHFLPPAIWMARLGQMSLPQVLRKATKVHKR